MWHPPAVTVAPSAEPVTLAAARDQCHLVAAESDFDARLTRLIVAARLHVEAYCGLRLPAQTLTLACDDVADLARLPVAPVVSIASLAYVDPAGETQVLDAGSYDLWRTGDGLEAAIVLRPGASWPARQIGSRLTVTAVVGYASVPEPLVAAMLILIATWFRDTEAKAEAGWTNVDSLLCNHRRFA